MFEKELIKYMKYCNFYNILYTSVTYHAMIFFCFGLKNGTPYLTLQQLFFRIIVR